MQANCAGRSTRRAPVGGIHTRPRGGDQRRARVSVTELGLHPPRVRTAHPLELECHAATLKSKVSSPRGFSKGGNDVLGDCGLIRPTSGDAYLRNGSVTTQITTPMTTNNSQNHRLEADLASVGPFHARASTGAPNLI